MPRPALHHLCRISEVAGLLLEQTEDLLAHIHGRDSKLIPYGDSDPVFFLHVFHEGAECIDYPFEFLYIRRADVYGKEHLSGNDVRSPGVHFHTPDSPHCSFTGLPGSPVEKKGCFRCGKKGVAPHVHGRCARMVGPSDDLHFSLGDADDGLDETEVETFALKDGALFDMEFDEGSQASFRPHRFTYPVQVKA